MLNLTLSPATLIGLLAAIIVLLMLAVYFAHATKRAIDTMIRQQREIIALLTAARDRSRNIEPEQAPVTPRRSEARLDDEDEAVDRPRRPRPAADLVARR